MVGLLPVVAACCRASSPPRRSVSALRSGRSATAARPPRSGFGRFGRFAGFGRVRAASSRSASSMTVAGIHADQPPEIDQRRFADVARLDQLRALARSLRFEARHLVRRNQPDIEPPLRVVDLRVGPRHRFLEHPDRFARGRGRPVRPHDLQPQIRASRLDVGGNRLGLGRCRPLQRVDPARGVDRPLKCDARHDVVGNVGIHHETRAGRLRKTNSGTWLVRM